MAAWANPETWLTCSIAVAAIIEAWALYKIWQLENVQEKDRKQVELPITLHKGTFNEEGLQTSDQDFIEVTNCSTTAVYIEQIKVEGERIADKEYRSISERVSYLINPYSTRRLNIYSPMSGVFGPLQPKTEKPASVKGQVKVSLKYRAFGKSFTSQAATFSGEIMWGEFREMEPPSSDEPADSCSERDTTH